MSASAPVTSSTSSVESRWAWPRFWEYALGLIIAVCAILVGLSASKLLTPVQPMSGAPRGIDLNVADEGTLRQLPGVGPHLAARIVEHRAKNGPFLRVDDLKNVKGIGPATLERMRPAVFVNSNGQPPPAIQPALSQPPPTKPKDASAPLIDLNEATKEQLMTLPGIGPVMAEKILEDRKMNGAFTTVNDLTRIKGIKAKTLEKLKPYVTMKKKEKGA